MDERKLKYLSETNGVGRKKEKQGSKWVRGSKQEETADKAE